MSEEADNAVEAPADEQVGEETQAEQSTEQYWPEDWRTNMAGDDEKTQKRLDRFGSPNDMYKSYTAMESKMSAGEVYEPLGDDPTEDQLAEWRKTNGVPESIDGYFENMPDGLVIGEDDKSLFESVADKLHGLNVKPEVMHTLVGWYDKLQEDAAATQHETDQGYQKNAEDALRNEWGVEYRQNINAVDSFLQGSFADGVGEKLLGARLSDGSLLADNSDVIKAFASISRELNPAATLVPATGASAGLSISDEIASIKKQMGNPNSEYWKGPKKDGETIMARRYEELLSADERMKKAG